MVDKSAEITASCLRSLLRPIILFCIKRSVGIKLLTEVAKEVFIQIASDELKNSNSPHNTSRLFMLTGINRKEIERLKKGENKVDISTNLRTKIIGQWQNDSRFCNKNKTTKKLHISEGENSFASLVALVSKELNPNTVLKEFERSKVVIRKNSYIELIMNEYAADDNIINACELISADYLDILIAAENNLEKKNKIPDLHFTTRYDNICPEYLPQIQQWLVDKGANFHKEARDYLSSFDKDLNPAIWQKMGGAKVSVGTFGTTIVSNSME